MDIIYLSLAGVGLFLLIFIAVSIRTLVPRYIQSGWVNIEKYEAGSYVFTASYNVHNIEYVGLRKTTQTSSDLGWSVEVYTKGNTPDTYHLKDFNTAMKLHNLITTRQEVVKLFDKELK